MENNLQQTSHVSARLFSKSFSITRPQSSSSICVGFERWLAKIYCNKVATPVISREVLLYYSLLKKPSKKNGKKDWKWNRKGGPVSERRRICIHHKSINHHIFLNTTRVSQIYH